MELDQKQHVCTAKFHFFLFSVYRYLSKACTLPVLHKNHINWTANEDKTFPFYMTLIFRAHLALFFGVTEQPLQALYYKMQIVVLKWRDVRHKTTKKFLLARVCIPETFCSEHKNRHSHWHHMVPILPICKSNDPLFPSIPSPFWQSLSVVCSCPPILHARQCWNGDKQTRLFCFGSWSNLYGYLSCSCGCWIGFKI